MADAKPPVSFRISRQLDQEKIDALEKRVEQLVSSNTELRSQAMRTGKDTQDLVQYFQREVEVKDDIIARLNEEMVRKETQLRNEVEKVRRTMTAEFSEYRREATATIESLKGRLESAESELNLLDAYRRNKAAHDEELTLLTKNVADQVQYTQNALDEQERKFMESRAALVKDLEDEKTAFRNIALIEARQTISVESKKVVAENIRLHDELKFHHAMTVELQAEKDRLITKCKTLQRDLDVLVDKDQEYARQSFVKSKEIKSLRDRVDQLEKAHVINTERFRMKAKELKIAVQKELEEATLDAAGLRRLMKIKNKELQVMKTLASTILSQRSDVEQFFLESLNEVKEKIRDERRNAAIAESQDPASRLRKSSGGTYKRGDNAGTSTSAGMSTSTTARVSRSGGTALPSIHPYKAAQEMADSEIMGDEPIPDVQVYVTDLSWEDKEVVLRLLFAKMNGLKRRKPQHPHAHGPGGTTPSPSKTNGKNAPVFISEGALDGMEGVGGVDPYLEMGHFIDAFEVPLGGDATYEGDAGENYQGGSSSGISGGYNLTRSNLA